MKILTMALAAFFLAWSAMGITASAPATDGKAVQYKVQDVVMEGYLVHNKHITGKHPGVLVVHEWWGLNDYARERARMLADLGYTALAVDMYGGYKVADHPDDAGKFSSELMKNFDVAKDRFIAAMDVLKKDASVDPSMIAAIGYCFGGGIVLNMARQGADLRGVASFHGNLAAVKPARPGSIKAKILVLNGGADSFTTPQQIADFKKEMDAAGADYRFISYTGAMHSFTNPEADELAKKFKMPIAYNADADKQSWEELQKFLKEIFKQ